MITATLIFVLESYTFELNYYSPPKRKIVPTPSDIPQARASLWQLDSSYRAEEEISYSDPTLWVIIS